MDFKQQLEDIANSLHGFIKSQNTHNENVMTEIASIKRGVYGDETNLVRGLMERQLEDERRLGKLESFKQRMIWTAAGFIVAVEGVVQLLKMVL